MTTFNISDKQVTNIHNAYCYLHKALTVSNDMFKDDSEIVQVLKVAMSYLKPVSDDVVSRKDKIFDQEMDRYSKIRELNDFDTIWSIFRYDLDFSLDEKHNYPIGASLVCYDIPDADPKFKVTGHTWLDLWKDVDRYYKNYPSLGFHQFIEGFKYTKESNTLYIQLGS